MRATISIIALLLAGTPASAFCPHYNVVARPLTGTTPAGLATADFNGDGHADFAVANSGANTVTVYLGNGIATPIGFTQADYAVGTSPRAMVAGDFNGDGKPDLAVANDGSTISILLNNGNGTFATAVTFAAGTSPHSIAAADFDGDGKLDLVTPNYLGGNVTVYRGDGMGGFTLISTLLGTDHPTAVAVADLNRDGKPDLAVTDEGTNDVAFFSNAGVGSFAAATYKTTGTSPNSIATADVNHDGIVDLVVAADNQTSVLLNDGSANFTNGMISIFSGQQVVAQDLKRDGTMTLVVTSGLNMTVIVLDASGTEIFNISYVVGVAMGGLAISDFNSDGRPDILLVEQGLTRVGVWTAPSCFANCASFTNAGVFATGVSPYGMAVGDFNRDGKLDLAVPNNGSQTLSILLGDGAGGFAAKSDKPTSATPYFAAAADFNGDGKLDVVVATPMAVGFDLMTGNGAGGFTKSSIFDGQSLYSVAVADFDRNGSPDIVLAAPNRPGISLFYYFPGGGFSGPARYDIVSTTFFATTGDFNGDGLTDVVTASGANDVTIQLAQPIGSRFGIPTSYPAGTSPKAIAVADFNHDGKLDLAVANHDSDNVSILLGDGLGGFAAPVNYAADSQPFSIAVADLNLDGNPDLAVANFNANNVTILLGNADGTFTNGGSYGTGTNPSSVVVGDFDRDGKPDLAVANAGSANVTLLRNRCLFSELRVVKSHTGTFTQGQTGAQYTIAVDNSGTAATSGTVSVVDTLPAGLIATGLTGSGWSCILSNLTCTRSDALATPASYPSITLTATVRSNAPSPITNVATLSGGGDVDPDNNVSSNAATVTPASLIAPTDLVATAQSVSQINVTWDAVTGASNGYLVLRTHDGVPEELSSPTAGYTDTNVVANKTYMYQVAAIKPTMTAGPASNKDIATTILFTDDPLVPVIKAVHFTELRTAVNAVRIAGGMGIGTFTHTIAPGASILAIDLTDLRTYLDQARTTLGLPPVIYSEPIVAGATTIKAAHILELRFGVK